MKSKEKINLHLVKALRASFLAKFTIYFGLLSFLFVSCNPEVETITIESPSVSISSAVFNANDGIGLYNTMELFRSVAVSNDIKSPEELLSYFSGIDSAEPIAKLVKAMDDETTRFNELGYEGYIQEKVSKNELSSNMKDWLLDYKLTVLKFMETKPSENEFMSYFSDIDNFGYLQNLSLEEVSLVTKTLNDAKEYAKYYYLHYSMDDDGSRDADCNNFWEKLGCGLLYVAIYVVIFIALVLLIEWGIAAGGVIINGSIGTSLSGAAAIEALLLVDFQNVIGGWTKSFFEWCCGKKEEKICAAPTGAYFKEVGCNRFRYTIFGPGNYSTTTWVNTNTTPAAAVTSSPSLVVSIPSVGTPSDFMASILCVELPSGNPSTFPWNETLTLPSTNTNFPALQWAQTPPQEVSIKDVELYGDDIELSILPANEALYTYEWEVTDNAGIEGHGSDAFLALFEPGLVGVTVTVTHKCTGESKTKSTIITVTE